MWHKFLHLFRVVLILSLLLSLSFPLVALATRFEFWGVRTAFMLIGGLALCGAALFLLSGIVLLSAQRQGLSRHRNQAMLSIVILMLPLGFLMAHAIKLQQVPMIHDVTTDIKEPPKFVNAYKLRGKGVENDLEYVAETGILQQQAYPDLHPAVVSGSMADVMAKAIEVANRQGWEVVYQNPATGQIEATDTSFWFGFVDDIVIRLRPEGDLVRVDVRSVSRMGKSDLGKNAERIRRFMAQIEGAI